MPQRKQLERLEAAAHALDDTQAEGTDWLAAEQALLSRFDVWHHRLAVARHSSRETSQEFWERCLDRATKRYHSAMNQLRLLLSQQSPHRPSF